MQLLLPLHLLVETIQLKSKHWAPNIWHMQLWKDPSIQQNQYNNCFHQQQNGYRCEREKSSVHFLDRSGLNFAIGLDLSGDIIQIYFFKYKDLTILQIISKHMNETGQSKKNLIQKLEQFDPQMSRSSVATLTPGEHHFDNYYEYILSLVGFAVGFGSFWRFPYLVYKNGGGAFLIPYFAAIILLGMPLLYLETVTGQMHQISSPFIFAKINKGYKMLGITFLLCCFHLAGYYNVILAYSYRFLFSAFQNPLGFSDETPFQNKYFNQEILGASPSIQQFGHIQPFLFLLYAISLFICYLIVKNGVKTSGKVVMVTSLLPYFFFIILLTRAVFLEGAMDGVKYLLVPDFSKLFAIEIWIDAIVQVFYQLSVAVAGIMNFSSLKPKKEKHLLGVYIIPLSILICGMLCALNIFMYLGHFCLQQNLDIRKLTLSGPQLSFNIFPKALAILPWPNLWVLFFFIAMVFLGIDSEFGYLQACYCYIKDQAKVNHNGKVRVCGWDFHPDTIKLAIVAGIMIFCPFMTCSAGIYYLQFFDQFVATVPISLGALINYIFFVKIIPFDELERQSKKATDQQAPKWIRYLLEGKIVIVILFLNFGLAFLNQVFYFFKYSFKFYLLGWFITAYPYVLAYLYYRKNKEEKTLRTFAEFKKARVSEL